MLVDKIIYLDCTILMVIMPATSIVKLPEITLRLIVIFALTILIYVCSPLVAVIYLTGVAMCLAVYGLNTGGHNSDGDFFSR